MPPTTTSLPSPALAETQRSPPLGQASAARPQLHVSPSSTAAYRRALAGHAAFGYSPAVAGSSGAAFASTSRSPSVTSSNGRSVVSTRSLTSAAPSQRFSAAGSGLPRPLRVSWSGLRFCHEEGGWVGDRVCSGCCDAWYEQSRELLRGVWEKRQWYRGKGRGRKATDSAASRQKVVCFLDGEQGHWHGIARPSFAIPGLGGLAIHHYVGEQLVEPDGQKWGPHFDHPSHAQGQSKQQQHKIRQFARCKTSLLDPIVAQFSDIAAHTARDFTEDVCQQRNYRRFYHVRRSEVRCGFDFNDSLALADASEV
ncbi:hypothetical protein V8E36_008258 [Tilletia maclaganii]